MDTYRSDRETDKSSIRGRFRWRGKSRT